MKADKAGTRPVSRFFLVPAVVPNGTASWVRCRSWLQCQAGN
jgi:hypothetical protein